MRRTPPSGRAPIRLLSVVIPCHNEEEAIEPTVRAISQTLDRHAIDHEVVCVDDHCTDGTARVLATLHAEDARWRAVTNRRLPGFGLAIQTGIDASTGDAVVIVMADASDDPADIVRYVEKLREGYDCVFGTRFHPATTVREYPPLKLLLNRIVNKAIQAVFLLPYNDVTNAFKCYRREVLHGVSPILAHHFNLTVELPLKAIVRGYSYTWVPTNWYGRTTGVSKLKIKEMGSRYLFIILYVWIERALSRGDYHSRRTPAMGVPASDPVSSTGHPPDRSAVAR
jgi:dolichol-phosphate mannosyltransferase